MGKQYSSASIRIDGMANLQREMKRLAPKVHAEFYKDMRQIAGVVVADVRSQMPERTGNARRSVKPSFSGGTVQVQAGGPKAPYYPWLDFGGKGVVGWKPSMGLSSHGRYMKKDKRPFEKEGRWIYPTIARLRPDIYRRAVAAVERAKKAAHLS